MRIYWDKKLYDGDEEFGDVVKGVLEEEDLKEIMKSQIEEGNLVEKALNADNAPPAQVVEEEALAKGGLKEVKEFNKGEGNLPVAEKALNVDGAPPNQAVKGVSAEEDLEETLEPHSEGKDLAEKVLNVNSVPPHQPII